MRNWKKKMLTTRVEFPGKGIVGINVPRWTNAKKKQIYRSRTLFRTIT